MTALFDQYKIENVTVKFMWNTNSSTVPSGGITATGLGQYGFAVDRNDATAPSTRAGYEAYGDLVVKRQDQISEVSFRPQFAVAAYTGLFTGYASKTGWVDCDSPNVQHYGLKYFTDCSMQSNTGLLDRGRLSLFITYDVALRYVR
jgi:hypothetical protein